MDYYLYPYHLYPSTFMLPVNYCPMDEAKSLFNVLDCFSSETQLKLIVLQLSGPSMQDEQREKQLNPIEYLSDTCQILKRSMYTRKSSVNDGGERTTTSSTIKSSSLIPPSPYKVDPFVNHIAPFTIFDKIKVKKLNFATFFHEYFHLIVLVI